MTRRPAPRENSKNYGEIQAAELAAGLLFEAAGVLL